jgi:PAB1-binding protein PBP1
METTDNNNLMISHKPSVIFPSISLEEDSSIRDTSKNQSLWQDDSMAGSSAKSTPSKWPTWHPPDMTSGSEWHSDRIAELKWGVFLL